jgi:hypothetical protein
MNHVTGALDLARTLAHRLDELARTTRQGYDDPSRAAFDQQVLGELKQAVRRLDGRLDGLNAQFDRALRLLDD